MTELFPARPWPARRIDPLAAARRSTALPLPPRRPGQTPPRWPATFRYSFANRSSAAAFERADRRRLDFLATDAEEHLALRAANFDGVRAGREGGRKTGVFTARLKQASQNVFRWRADDQPVGEIAARRTLADDLQRRF